MTEREDILKQLCWRVLMAAPFFIAGVSAQFGFASPFLILTGAIIVARPLSRLLAEPWGNLLFPSDHFDKPQPIYGIPEARRQEGKYEEAIQGFQKILVEHPQEVRAYVSMIDVAIVNLKDEARANAIFQNGIAKLKRAEDRDQLASAYSNIRSRIVSDRDGVPDRQPISTDRMKRRPW